MGLSNELSSEAGSFSLPQVPQFFSVRGIEALFPWAGPLGCTICLTPQLFLPVYPHANVGPPSLPATTSPTQSSNCHLAGHPLPFLPVCINVSSLTPWLLDFHTVPFSGSSGCFWFLNLLFSFYWLCEEAKYIYLHLHLGWKSCQGNFLLGAFFCIEYMLVA